MLFPMVVIRNSDSFYKLRYTIVKIHIDLFCHCHGYLGSCPVFDALFNGVEMVQVDNQQFQVLVEKLRDKLPYLNIILNLNYEFD